MFIKTLQIIFASWAVLMVSKFVIGHFGQSFPSFLSFLNSIGLIDITILAGSLSFILWIIYKSGLMYIKAPNGTEEFLAMIFVFLLFGGIVVGIVFSIMYINIHSGDCRAAFDKIQTLEQTSTTTNVE